jgi:protein PET117
MTLLGTSLFAMSTIVFVHFQQKAEQDVRTSPITELTWPSTQGKEANEPPKKAMHQGVIRDMEQQRIKRERQLDFDMQRALEEEYKREQNVRSSLEVMGDKDNGGGGSSKV